MNTSQVANLHSYAGYLPNEIRPECLMIYLGDDGSTTSDHMDICLFISHNVMVCTDQANPFVDTYALWRITGSQKKEAAIQ